MPSSLFPLIVTTWRMRRFVNLEKPWCHLIGFVEDTQIVLSNLRRNAE